MKIYTHSTRVDGDFGKDNARHWKEESSRRKKTEDLGEIIKNKKALF